jgi:hypothetical protein
MGLYQQIDLHLLLHRLSRLDGEAHAVVDYIDHSRMQGVAVNKGSRFVGQGSSIVVGEASGTSVSFARVCMSSERITLVSEL